MISRVFLFLVNISQVIVGIPKSIYFTLIIINQTQIFKTQQGGQLIIKEQLIEMDEDIQWFNIFVEECWYIDFIAQNQVFKEICQSARNTFKADKIVGQSVEPISCGLQTDPGFDKFLDANTNRCQQLMVQRVHFCHTCEKVYHGAALCEGCFLGAKHRENGHATSSYEVPQQMKGKLRCQCGDRYLFKKKGSCAKHSSILNQEIEALGCSSFKQHIVGCFKVCYALEKESQQQKHSQQIQQKIKSTSQLYFAQFIKQLAQLLDETAEFTPTVEETIYSTTVIGVNWSNQNIHIVQYYMRKCCANPKLLDLLSYLHQQKTNRILYRLLEYAFSKYIGIKHNIIDVGQNIQKKVDKKEEAKVFKKLMNYQNLIKGILKSTNSCQLLCRWAEDKLSNDKNRFNKQFRQIIIKLYYMVFQQLAKHNLENLNPVALSKLLIILSEQRLLSQIPTQQLPYVMMCAMVSNCQDIVREIFTQVISQINRWDSRTEQLLHIIAEVLLVKYQNDPKQVVDYLSNSPKYIMLLYKMRSVNPDKQWVGYIRQSCKNSCGKIVKWLSQEKQRKLLLQKHNLIKQQSLLLEQTQLGAPQKYQKQQQQQQAEQKHQKIIQKQSKKQQCEQNLKEEKVRGKGQKTQIKMKSQKELLIERKKLKLQQKYAQKQSKIQIPEQIVRIKSNDRVCIVCRYPGNENKHLFNLGNLYTRTNNYQQLILKNKFGGKYGLRICEHPIHSDCFIKMQINYLMGQRCPLCRQRSNIGILAQDQIFTNHISAQLLQILELNNIFKEKKDVLKVFQQLFAIFVGEMYLKLFFYCATPQEKVVNSKDKNCKQLVHMLRSMHQWNNTATKFSSKQMEIDHNNQVVINPNQLNKVNKIEFNNANEQVMLNFNKIVFLVAISQITGQLQIQQTIQCIRKLEKYLATDEVWRIMGGVSDITGHAINSKVEQIEQKKMAEQPNEIGVPRKKLMDYLFDIPENLIQIANGLKPLCKKYKQHLNGYWMCIMCNKLLCSKCDKSVEEHKADHSQACARLGIFNGVLTICVRNKIDTTQIYQPDNPKPNVDGVRESCWAYLNYDKYREAIYNWISMMETDN